VRERERERERVCNTGLRYIDEMRIRVERVWWEIPTMTFAL